MALYGVAGSDVDKGSGGDGKCGGDREGGDNVSFDDKGGRDQGDKKGQTGFSSSFLFLSFFLSLSSPMLCFR